MFNKIYSTINKLLESKEVTEISKNTGLFPQSVHRYMQKKNPAKTCSKSKWALCIGTSIIYSEVYPKVNKKSRSFT